MAIAIVSDISNIPQMDMCNQLGSYIRTFGERPVQVLDLPLIQPPKWSSTPGYSGAVLDKLRQKRATH